VLILFLKGAFLGLALAAPVGPINLLCMKRSLEQGQRVGLITGLGAATGDTIYGSIAAFGLTFISDWLETYKAPLSIVGGIFFFILGVSLIRSKKGVKAPDEKMSSHSAYFSTVILTLSNPTVVFSFLAAFAMIKLNTHQGDHVRPIYALFATVGVFCGSMLWWTFLSWLSAKFRAALNERAIHRINVGAGILLLIFALVILSRGAQGLSAQAVSSSAESSTR
jgi:threonine/homoserine/homoserine lactone efflux protein